MSKSKKEELIEAKHKLGKAFAEYNEELRLDYDKVPMEKKLGDLYHDLSSLVETQIEKTILGKILTVIDAVIPPNKEANNDYTDQNKAVKDIIKVYIKEETEELLESLYECMEEFGHIIGCPSATWVDEDIINF